MISNKRIQFRTEIGYKVIFIRSHYF